jgi:pimeloyl-ACP methyl ester carboxylesterase
VDEFVYLADNAAQAGVSGPLPPVARVQRGPISALRWGTGEVRVVFLHGGGQNAHTWDTVILGLGLPALAIDLPGHGRSEWREDGDYGPALNAHAVEPMIGELAPRADLVVGMSLGGLTAMRLAVTAGHLVPRLVMVDVTPSAPERHEQMTKAQMGAVALVQGERSFPSFEAMVDATVAASPHRSRESLQRGVFHNAKQLDDGTWTWRYDTFRSVPSDERSESGNRAQGFAGLWDDALALHTPTTLVRGAKSFFVNDDDATEFARSAPGFQNVIVVPDAGHSVQGDQPRALVDILRSVLD